APRWPRWRTISRRHGSDGKISDSRWIIYPTSCATIASRASPSARDTSGTRSSARRASASATAGPPARLPGGATPRPADWISAGDFVTGTLARHSLLGPLDLRYGVDGDAGIGRGASGLAGTRAWASSKGHFGIGPLAGSLTGRISGAAGDSLPQLMFRAGGP